MISLLEQKLKIEQIYLACLILVASVVVGYLLVLSPFLLILAFLAVAWLVLLPYHTNISVWLAVATFGSAIIVPKFPGRMFVWEAAALLAWSGLVLTVSFRQYHADYLQTIRSNRWLFFGVAGYCLVLLTIMYYRGVGLRILGTSQMGGRYYFQQMACAIFPLLFVMYRSDEKTLTRLFFLQCILSGTYLISDFAYSYGGSSNILLSFFEVPGDAVNFEYRSQNFGLRRFQSLGIIGQAFIFAILILFGLKDFFSRRGIFLLPAGGLIFFLGLYSGHRWVIVIVGLTLIFCCYSQRFFNIRNTVVAVAASVVVLFVVYGFADAMPLTVQRAISVLPGIDIDTQARIDGASTMETRRLLRRAGWDLIPNYLWMGRGFGLSSQVDYSSLWEPTGVTAHVNQGKFYNGIIGLLVNTGVPGTFFMLMFLAAGTWVAWKIIRYIRRHGCEDSFSRMCSIISGLWMANITAFLFVGGDSESALKTFSLQAGLLLACLRLLEERLKKQPGPGQAA